MALDRALWDSAKSVYKKNVYVIDEKRGLVQPTVAKRCGPTLVGPVSNWGLEIITAHSPVAKGRVERNRGIYQDRLVKELRLASIDTITAANEFLAGRGLF